MLFRSQRRFHFPQSGVNAVERPAENDAEQQFRELFPVLRLLKRKEVRLLNFEPDPAERLFFKMRQPHSGDFGVVRGPLVFLQNAFGQMKPVEIPFGFPREKVLRKRIVPG